MLHAVRLPRSLSRIPSNVSTAHSLDVSCLHLHLLCICSKAIMRVMRERPPSFCNPNTFTRNLICTLILTKVQAKRMQPSFMCGSCLLLAWHIWFCVEMQGAVLPSTSKCPCHTYSCLCRTAQICRSGMWPRNLGMCFWYAIQRFAVPYHLVNNPGSLSRGASLERPQQVVNSI